MILKCNGLLVFIVLVSAYPLSAQKDFRAGFAVLSNGDTLHGFVNYGSPKRNISLCQFRPDKNSSVVEYKPDQLLAYGFTGDKFYESRNYSSSEGVKKVFMEIVVKGKLSILKYGVQFYVQKAPGDLVELKTEQKEKKVNGVIEVITVNSFVGVLNSITQDCPAVHDVVSKTRLSTKSLSEFAVQYNSCVGSKLLNSKAKRSGW